jgi:hypothetical protein
MLRSWRVWSVSFQTLRTQNHFSTSIMMREDEDGAAVGDNRHPSEILKEKLLHELEENGELSKKKLQRLNKIIRPYPPPPGLTHDNDFELLHHLLIMI